MIFALRSPEVGLTQPSRSHLWRFGRIFYESKKDTAHALLFSNSQMSKTLKSVVGVDVGRYSLKSVLLQKKGDSRFVVSNFASHVFDESVERTPDEIVKQIKSLVKQMGGGSKACAVAITTPDAFLRIIEQPETPTEILRDALRLNGMALLNQDCRDFVLDCDLIPTTGAAAAIHGGQKRYLVAGLPRVYVSGMSEALENGKFKDVASLQLPSVSVFNAFEFAQPDVFNNQAFFLLDLGHTSSTMMIGVKGELVLIRNIDFGGKTLLETLCSLSGESTSVVFKALEQEDEIIVENARMALMAFTREIGSSIGFVEGRREETIGQIWVSGGLAKNKTVLRVLGEELRMPCLAWNALDRCEVNVPASKRSRLTEDVFDYSVACGAAVQLFNT